MSNILVVDDDPALALTMSLALQGMGDIHSATSFDAAVKTLGLIHPAVMVTDFCLGSKNGHDLARAARELPNPPELILISGYATKEIAIEAIDLRYQSLLEKPFTLEELRQRVSRALAVRAERQSAGTVPVGAAVASDSGLGIQLEPDFRSVRIKGREVSLTRTEYRIFSMLVQSGGMPVSRQLLVDNIWGDLAVSEHSFDTHFCNIKRKLPELKDRLRTIRGEGYVLQA